MSTAAWRPREGEQGFTIIELMVVVLVIALLLAIAIPSFLGARRKANDRVAQGRLRDALLAELIVHTDNQRFTDDVTELRKVEANLVFTQALAAMAPGGPVYVQMLPDTATPDDSVLLGAKSGSGGCFWVRMTVGPAQTAYASGGCAAVPAPAAFGPDW